MSLSTLCQLWVPGKCLPCIQLVCRISSGPGACPTDPVLTEVSFQPSHLRFSLVPVIKILRQEQLKTERVHLSSQSEVISHHFGGSLESAA